jgi:hypothetical protein
MISTNIGAVTLTENQLLNYSPEGVWERFSYVGGEVIGVSETAPEQSDIDALKAQLALLPDTIPQRVYRNNFNLVSFQTDLANLLPTLSDINLRWEFAALNTYATNKDFEGMAGYMDMLVNGGVAVQADDDAVIALLIKQGIVLGEE